MTEGHPDKLCDKISDAILDAYLAGDPQARVACETAAAKDSLTIIGEITSHHSVDIVKTAKRVASEVGYTSDELGFNSNSCGIYTCIHNQSDDIFRGVSKARDAEASASYSDTGAGDQGMMFGYACTDTDELMPAPIYYAHKLCRQLSAVRKQGTLPYLGPDGKSMVTVRYEDNVPVGIEAIVISTQHRADVEQKQICEDLVQHVIYSIIPQQLLSADTKIYVNPTGRFAKGGPAADVGLTGRKIIVDTYGGIGRHGGGAFSGKDPTKVDRTGAYAARYVAKNIVAARIAKRCEVQIAYVIGMAKPVSVYIDTFGTSQYEEEKISRAVQAIFDLRPAAIIDQFQMRRPIYEQLSAYGHFGREDLELPWEKTDKADEIREMLNCR